MELGAAVLAALVVGSLALVGVLLGAKRTREAQLEAERERHRLTMEADAQRHRDSLELERSRLATAVRSGLYRDLAAAASSVNRSLSTFLLTFQTNLQEAAESLEGSLLELERVNEDVALYASEEVAHHADDAANKARLALTAGQSLSLGQARAPRVHEFASDFDVEYGLLVEFMRKDLGTTQ